MKKFASQVLKGILAWVAMALYLVLSTVLVLVAVAAYAGYRVVVTRSLDI